MYQLKSTGASAFKYFKKTRSFNHAGSQTYQDFYYELRAVKYETLLKANQSSTFQGKKVTEDEVMSPSIQNSIVVDWLAGIDEDLVEEAEQQAQLGVPHSRIQVELGFILQAGTCQILNSAQNPRQSQSVQST